MFSCNFSAEVESRDATEITHGFNDWQTGVGVVLSVLGGFVLTVVAVFYLRR